MSFSSDKPLLSNQLPISLEYPEDPKEFLEFIGNNYVQMANTVNSKEGALYLPQELATFQQYFSTSAQRTRNIYRMVVNFGALPNTGVKTVAHGLTLNSACSITRVYGAASNPTGLLYLPLPYASPTLANNIELSLDSANVIITTGSNRSAFTICTVVIEFAKNQ